MMPIRGIFPGCCALATSGQAAAPPPSSVMNWRRLGSNMGSSPEPAVPAYRRLRMHRKLPQVLGVDLKSSESTPLAAASLPDGPARAALLLAANGALEHASPVLAPGLTL